MRPILLIPEGPVGDGWYYITMGYDVKFYKMRIYDWTTCCPNHSPNTSYSPVSAEADASLGAVSPTSFSGREAFVCSSASEEGGDA